MRRYELVSGIFFTLLCLGQGTRTLLGWPAQINGVNIPLWPSALAFLATGSLAVWAFRSARASDAT